MTTSWVWTYVTYPVELVGESGGSGLKNTFLSASRTVMASVKTRYVSKNVFKKSMFRNRRSVKRSSNRSGVAYRICGICNADLLLLLLLMMLLLLIMMLLLLLLITTSHNIVVSKKSFDKFKGECRTLH